MEILLLIPLFMLFIPLLIIALILQLIQNIFDRNTSDETKILSVIGLVGIFLVGQEMEDRKKRNHKQLR